jgi:hypothetical protein
VSETGNSLSFDDSEGVDGDWTTSDALMLLETMRVESPSGAKDCDGGKNDEEMENGVGTHSPNSDMAFLVEWTTSEEGSGKEDVANQSIVGGSELMFFPEKETHDSYTPLPVEVTATNEEDRKMSPMLEVKGWRDEGPGKQSDAGAPAMDDMSRGTMVESDAPLPPSVDAKIDEGRKSVLCVPTAVKDECGVSFIKENNANRWGAVEDKMRFSIMLAEQYGDGAKHNVGLENLNTMMEKAKEAACSGSVSVRYATAIFFNNIRAGLTCHEGVAIKRKEDQHLDKNALYLAHKVMNEVELSIFADSRCDIYHRSAGEDDSDIEEILKDIAAAPLSVFDDVGHV